MSGLSDRTGDTGGLVVSFEVMRSLAYRFGGEGAHDLVAFEGEPPDLQEHLRKSAP